MSRTTDLQVRCQHCSQWFRSLIWVADSDRFDTSLLFGHRQECPHCYSLTRCNHENFMARFENGSFLGQEV